MSRQFSRDFLIEVQRGNIPGHSMVHKFGRSTTVGTAFGHISSTPFAITDFRSSAVAMRVKAGGSVNDASGGTHAEQVTVQGIDSTQAEVTATATLAGAGTAAISGTWWRIHRAWVSESGTYGNANENDIVIEDTGGAADYITVLAGEGQTQYAGWSVPAAKTAYLLSVHVTTDTQASRTVDIRCFTRKDIFNGATKYSPRLKLFWGGLTAPFVYLPHGPELSIAGGSDIWFEAKASTGSTTVVTVDFELLCVDD